MTLLNTAGGTAVLALHPGGVFPLLQKAGFINGQGIITRVQVILDRGPHLIAHTFHLPIRAAQDRLEDIQHRMTSVLRYLPAIPPFDLAQQTLDRADHSLPGVRTRHLYPNPIDPMIERSSQL